MIYEGGASLMVSFCFAFSNSMQVGASFIFVFVESERSAFTTICFVCSEQFWCIVVLDICTVVLVVTGE